MGIEPTVVDDDDDDDDELMNDFLNTVIILAVSCAQGLMFLFLVQGKCIFFWKIAHIDAFII